MKKLIALLLAAFSALSQAAVVPKDINGDGKFTAFLDQKNSLLWTNGNVFKDIGPLNYANATSAINGLNTSSFEGTVKWRLPTISEFESLYNTQGNVGGKMIRGPLEVLERFYWTSDPFNEKHRAFGFDAKDQRSIQADFIRLNVWAVSPVPEPEAYLMLLSGLGMIGVVARRRRAKQT